eukprot:NODE_11233_length_264_cov_19.032558_g9463_i0.p3 GENE.NODE_11233_length_264_cov_19.032558_g9463_i0~~NODE_11233_length_264_cov_19.032558_g9463_i0.p3  ORF type:complete len:72 (-),score=14.71 NODE_11233_length_264_cov_19.032558_g9463_i0:39-254(-)
MFGHATQPRGTFADQRAYLDVQWTRFFFFFLESDGGGEKKKRAEKQTKPNEGNEWKEKKTYAKRNTVEEVD